MPRRRILLALCMALGVAPGGAMAGPEAVPHAGTGTACRIGFDIGSSGIRVGSTMDDRNGRVGIDYLADVWPDNRIDQTNDLTASSLTAMISGSPCLAVAGAYSAWRHAVHKGGAEEMVATLRDLNRRTGVFIYVIPQAVEGAYGYYAAARQLGPRLKTPFVLDMGGGSLQVAAADRGWGTAMGQRAWRKAVCTEIKKSPAATCPPNPVGEDAIGAARRLLAGEIADARATLGQGLKVTAVSAPVVRGVHPVLRHLASKRPAEFAGVDRQGFTLGAVDHALSTLASRDDAGILDALDGCGEGTASPFCSAAFVSTFVTDMLLVRTVMEGLGIERLDVAAADLTNVPGLLNDRRASSWAGRYPCYLSRLRHVGVDAYLSDPGTCAATPAE